MRYFFYSIILFSYFSNVNSQTIALDVKNMSSINNRLSFRTNSNDIAHVGFEDQETKLNLFPSEIQIFEKALFHFVDDLTVIDSTRNDYKNNKNSKINIQYKREDDLILFKVKENYEYLIYVKSDGFKDELTVFNWRELIQNQAVKLAMTKRNTLTIVGEVSLKKVSIKIPLIKLQFTDTKNGNKFTIPIDATGKFIIDLELGHNYTITCSHPGETDVNYEINIPQKKQIFALKSFKTRGFDIIIEEPYDIKSVSKTPKYDIQVDSNNKFNSLHEYFLGDSKLDFTKGQRIQLSNYEFDYNSYVFSEYCKNEFDQLLKLLRTFPKMKISIRIYTDSRGDSSYNQRLTLDIAEKVSQYLKTRGLDGTRLLLFGMGESQLNNQCTNGTICPESEHLINRRAEIQILDI